MWLYPVGLTGQDDVVRTSEVPGDCPGPLSLKEMRRLQINQLYGSDQMQVRGEEFPMEKHILLQCGAQSGIWGRPGGGRRLEGRAPRTDSRRPRRKTAQAPSSQELQAPAAPCSKGEMKDEEHQGFEDGAGRRRRVQEGVDDTPFSRGRPRLMKEQEVESPALVTKLEEALSGMWAQDIQQDQEQKEFQGLVVDMLAQEICQDLLKQRERLGHSPGGVKKEPVMKIKEEPIVRGPKEMSQSHIWCEGTATGVPRHAVPGGWGAAGGGRWPPASPAGGPDDPGPSDRGSGFPDLPVERLALQTAWLSPEGDLLWGRIAAFAPGVSLQEIWLMDHPRDGVYELVAIEDMRTRPPRQCDPQLGVTLRFPTRIVSQLMTEDRTGRPLRLAIPSGAAAGYGPRGVLLPRWVGRPDRIVQGCFFPQ